MNDQLQLIAERIRGMREITDMSAETLATDLNLPLDAYLQYENGKADIPVSVLYKIASIFHVELSSLLTGEEPKLHMYAVVRKGKGVNIDRRKEYEHQSLAFNFAHKKAEPFLVSVAPAPDKTPYSLNAHPGQEFNYVLEGSLGLIVGGHEIVLNEGDSLFFDSNYEHGMKALNNVPVKFLAIIF